MATPVTQTASNQPFLKGSIIWEKKGPLPVWAWALLALGLVLVVVWWRRNRSAASEANEAATGTDELPGDQGAPPVFIIPPGPIGPPGPPGPPGVPGAPPYTRPDPSKPRPNPTPTVPPAPPGGGRPAPPKVPTPKPAPPKGGYVSVTKWPDRTKPKESTLWDIANAWLPQGAAQWALIWNHPLSADVKRKRGDVKRIQPGDKLFVPGKLAKPR